jgi:hypothetical protein
MSKGNPMTFDEETAKSILKNDSQIVPVKDDDGQWHGRSINKAHIVSTDFDMDRERSEAEKARRFIPKLNEAPPTPEQIKKVEEEKQKIRDKFRIKK